MGPLFNDYNTVAFTLLLDESEPQHHRQLLCCGAILTPCIAEIWNNLMMSMLRQYVAKSDRYLIAFTCTQSARCLALESLYTRRRRQLPKR